MQRRHLLKSALALTAAGIPVTQALAAPNDARTLGTSRPFDFAALKGMARALSGKPYRSPQARLPAVLRNLNWDQYQSIRFRHNHALWHDDKLKFRIEFFHLGRGFTKPVRMHQVVDGRATEIAYDSAMFDYGNSGIDGHKLPPDLGFAGWRLFCDGDWTRDVAAFLGASYFRAVDKSKQYGLSARGLAIDTGMSRPEEFPDFVAYWFERPASSSNTLTVYALLDSPSIAGAYRFDIKPGDEPAMALDVALYPRTTIERLGIAPLTSMYWCGENQKLACDDWRPEIHDSDGLSIWTGASEWIWRPLNVPKQLRVDSFVDDHPHGFGLMQRDRNFDHYQDDGVWYNRRPSLWVEPKGDWHKGTVQLVELHTDDEINDNVVAYWNPVRKTQRGEEWLLGYNLYWGSEPPHTSPLAHVVATRVGAGGMVGQARTYYSRRFVIDFQGGLLADLPTHAKVEAVVGLSNSNTELISARPLTPINGYRAMFDVVPDKTTQPIDMRLYLRLDGKPLTETWLYQWIPPALAQRKF